MFNISIILNADLLHNLSKGRIYLGNPLFSIEALVKSVETYSRRTGQALQEKRLDRKRKDQVLATLDNDIPKSIELIRVSIQMMRKLLDGLHQVATVGYRTLTISQVDMNALLKQITETLAPAIACSGAVVTVGDLPSCRGDLVQLNEVFSNLLVNAMKYLDPNREGRIRISGYRQDNMSIYCVQDNGIGIAPEHQSKIFDLFHRVDPDGDVDGEGLGLSIVQRLVTHHRGRLWLESEPGRTSKFFVALPHGSQAKDARMPGVA